VELGIDVKTISELLGHSNVNITLNRYVHPAFECRKNCIEMLVNSFSA
jgi:site-specific recombinase XerD